MKIKLVDLSDKETQIEVADELVTGKDKKSQVKWKGRFFIASPLVSPEYFFEETNIVSFIDLDDDKHPIRTASLQIEKKED